MHTFVKEIRYNIKGIIILALCFGLFFLAFMAIYDPTLFEDMEAGRYFTSIPPRRPPILMGEGIGA